jgi:D,D-heptose 1,7-bisphosphate phosphatase
MNRRPALFLDRDGVINIDHAYVSKPENFEFVDGIFDLCRTAKELGYFIFVVTNQAGIGRGYYTEQDFWNLTDWMAKEFEMHGAGIDKVYFCPSHPEHGIGKYKVDSPNRKPKPGMILQAVKEFEIDLARSVVVGDKGSDIQAGVTAGVGCNLLYCPLEREQLLHTGANAVVGSLAEVSYVLYRAQIANIKHTLVERNERVVGLIQAICDKEVHIGNLERALKEREGQLSKHIQVAAEIRGSTSWRLTRPIRFVGFQLLRIKLVFKAVPFALSSSGGYRGLIKNVWRAYKNEGIRGIKRRILDSVALSAPSQPDRNDYSEWVRRYDTLTDQDREKIKVQINRLHNPPLISMVMPVYNPPLNMLEDAIRSVQDQLYPHWELCIADDASTDAGVQELLQRYMDNDSRIKVVFRENNGHISAASNSALELVNGDYVALLDNDDLLREHALFWIVDAVVTHPDAGLIYSDEDKIDQSGLRYDPYFKPDWNPDLFLSHNMICHLGAYRTDLVKKLGGFREGYEGAQDYDLALRCSEQLAPLQIVHIPRVLYHWRSHPGSTALAGNEKNYALLAGERALNDHFARTQVSAKVELLDFGMYRAQYAIPESTPLVSLIIPTRNGLSLVKQCIDSLFAKTTYKNFEVLIVDNNSDDPKTLDYFASLADNKKIRVLRDERPFNYSALNNAAINKARGEYVGLINNDIEVISPEWLDEMISLAIQPGVGAVGARLWYPNDTLQHGGCITGIGGVAGHSHKHLPRGEFGYFARAQLIQTVSVVTAACLIIKKSIYAEVGGLDEVNLKVAFNDVDFCLRVREAGYRNIWTPYAELYHHESATRGHEDTQEKQLRFRNEMLYMQKRWGYLLMNDPAYSPNLTLDREDFSYAWPPRISTL